MSVSEVPAPSGPPTSRASLFRPSSQAAAGRDVLRTIRAHGPLIWELSVRDVKDRFSGHMLGPLWAVAHPILLMIVYALVFTYVFPARGVIVAGQTLDLTAYILSGLIPWLCCQEVLTRSTTAISANASLVKQIVFPVEVLPLKTVAAALPAQLIATLFLVSWLVATGRWSFMLLLYPALLAVQVAFLGGCAMALSCLGAFVKDLREVIVVFCTINLFLQPILYVPDQLPHVIRPLLWINPFSHLTYVFQDALYFGSIGHPWAWVSVLVFSAFCLTAGYRLFRVMQPRFGDVL